MEAFDSKKKDCLKKVDHSKKGSVDSGIVAIIKKINKLKNYYTTSSCAGRIIVIERKKRKKHEDEWLYATHIKAKFSFLKKALKQEFKDDLWFKQEAFILHVCCREIEDAVKLIGLKNSLGFKRGGIITAKTKIIVELIGTGRIETIIGKKGKLSVTDNYLKLLVKEANEKMELNNKRLMKFEGALDRLK